MYTIEKLIPSDSSDSIELYVYVVILLLFFHFVEPKDRNENSDFITVNKIYFVKLTLFCYCPIKKKRTVFNVRLINVIIKCVDPIKRESLLY